MDAIQFKEVNATYGANQAEYVGLPGHQGGAPTFPFTCCMQLDEQEKAHVAKTGKIWLSQLTFNHALQPIRLSTLKPVEVGPDEGQELSKGILSLRDRMRQGATTDEPEGLILPESSTDNGELKMAAAYLLTRKDMHFPESWSFAQKRKLGMLHGVEALEAAKIIIEVEMLRLKED